KIMRIDSHHHFWNYSAEEYGWIGEGMEVLRRDFGPGDLQQEIEPAGIDAVISVQARQTVEETRWLLEIANENAMIPAVVGWLPLADASVEPEIEKWSQHAKLKSLRHVVQDEPDDAFILGADFNRGVGLLHKYGLVYDILIFGKHLTNTITFVDQHPNQAFVLDHIAKPTIVASEFDESWKSGLQELARRENVTCKFSGVVTEVRDADWSVETIQPYWDVALEAFGSKRLMYGSDWPVCLLKSGYGRWVDAVKELSSTLSSSEQEDFWGNNAAAAYRIEI
ncbi:MAG: amidohydrolase family protein, partial [Planctomycetota bacterium]